MSLRKIAALGFAGAVVASLSACSNSGAASPSAASAAAGGLNLADVCPATVTVQTDWNPEAEHGHLYELVGPNPQIDAEKKTVTGDLMYKGQPTGVKIQVRAGGPAIGFQSVSATMYTDKDIMLGYVSTDEALRNSAKLPTKAVFAQHFKSPQIIMWDPATYPNANDIKTLGAEMKNTGGVIRYFNGAAYMDYLTGSGILDKSVTDGGYDGTPAKFVAAKGKDGQQGFATAEPYIYKNEVSAWGKDVKYQLIHDTGYEFYPEAMSVRAGDVEKDSACLKKLVPALQQADVDYMYAPDETNKLILDLVTQYNNGWVYSEGVATFAVEQMRALGIVANGPSGYIGEMNEERVQKIMDIDTPIFTKQDTPPKDGLKATDLFTNEFMDKTIKL